MSVEQAQAVRVRAVTAVACPDAQRLSDLAGRLRARGYAVRETPHFVVCRRSAGRRTMLLHRFDERTVDEDLAPLVAEELGLDTAQAYGDALFAVVASTSPPSLMCPECGRLHLDNPAIWRRYCTNSLERLRPLVAGRSGADSEASHIGRFAAVYRRVIESRVGRSVLDVGTNLGILPVLVAERADGVAVVGCDSRPESVACATDLAAATHSRATFVVGDVTAPDFPEIGRFDTVTAVHLLEHLEEDDLPAALANLLAAAARRLVVAVPYEDPVQPLYGHRQVCTPEKLRTWGRWCVERLGAGAFRCEEVWGGLLVLDRAA
jgi:SAM-dependent methyltransferase